MTSPRVEENRVVFRLHAPAASMVNCVGTFNHWDLARGVMKRDAEGFWTMETVVPLLGSYDYKFVVDGRWVTDPDNPEYGRDSHARINSRFSVHTSAASVDLLNEILSDLAADPPGRRLTARRRRAFERLDALFGLPTAPHARSIREVFCDAFERLLDPPPEVEGIYHLYNSGFLFRRAGYGLGIDLVSTRTVWSLYWEVPLRLVEALAARIDCLVVSHLHPDHLDHLLVRLVLDRDGLVLAPSEGIDRLPAGVRGVKADETVEAGPWKIRMPAGRHVYDDVGGLILRLVEAEAPGGPRILHTSDHDYTTGIPHTAKPDLLIPKSGGVSPKVDDALAMRNVILHLSPGFVLPSHINELGHPVKGGREPYATALAALAENPSPWSILFWGERLPWEALRG